MPVFFLANHLKARFQNGCDGDRFMTQARGLCVLCLAPWLHDHHLTRRRRGIIICVVVHNCFCLPHQSTRHDTLLDSTYNLLQVYDSLNPAPMSRANKRLPASVERMALRDNVPLAVFGGPLLHP